jgi:hypothetical protein
MRKVIHFIICLPLLLPAQHTTINDLEFDKADTITRPYTPKLNTPYIFIASKFGSNEVQRHTSLDSIRGFMIRDIELVFSQYHKSDKFNQGKLNDERWQHLLKEYPSLFSSGVTHFRNICQSGEQTDSTARKLTHGFYIYFEDRSADAKRSSEITEISKMLEKMGINPADTVENEFHDEEKTSVAAPDKADVTLKDVKTRGVKFRKPMRTMDPHACRQPYYEGKIDGLNQLLAETIKLSRRQKRRHKKLNGTIRLRIDYNGEIKSAQVSTINEKFSRQLTKAVESMYAWNPAVRNGVTVKSDVRFKVRYAEGKIIVDGDVIVPRNLAKCGTASDDELFDFSSPKIRESMIPKVFEVPDKELLRQVIERNPLMDSLLVVVDLTGSMGPYIAQVLDLMSDLVVKNDPYVCCFSLFNDGNNKPDDKKQVGKTGGITILNDNVTLDKLGKAVIKTMRNGNGGDSPENDMEALLKGLADCNNCRDVLMVADNFATPRDMILLREIARPLHWILCGVEGEINVDYLKMVHDNRGFLHTNKSDVTNLHLMKDGDMITIDGFTYQYVRGKYKRVKIS